MPVFKPGEGIRGAAARGCAGGAGAGAGGAVEGALQDFVQLEGEAAKPLSQQRGGRWGGAQGRPARNASKAPKNSYKKGRAGVSPARSPEAAKDALLATYRRVGLQGPPSGRLAARPLSSLPQPNSQPPANCLYSKHAFTYLFMPTSKDTLLTASM